MKGFLHTGCTIYQMFEISEAKMDALIRGEGERSWDWPYRFDKRRRIWPRPPKLAEVFFYDAP
jgi:hypothetical protein